MLKSCQVIDAAISLTLARSGIILLYDTINRTIGQNLNDLGQRWHLNYIIGLVALYVRLNPTIIHAQRR